MNKLETHLIATMTPRSHLLRIVPDAIQLIEVLAVGEIHQDVVTISASETGRVPEGIGHACRGNRWVPAENGLIAAGAH